MVKSKGMRCDGELNGLEGGWLDVWGGFYSRQSRSFCYKHLTLCSRLCTLKVILSGFSFTHNSSLLTKRACLVLIFLMTCIVSIKYDK